MTYTSRAPNDVVKENASKCGTETDGVKHDLLRDFINPVDIVLRFLVMRIILMGDHGRGII